MIAEEIRDSVETAKNGFNMQYVFIPAARIAMAKMAEQFRNAWEYLYEGEIGSFDHFANIKTCERQMIERGLIPNKQPDMPAENDNLKL